MSMPRHLIAVLTSIAGLALFGMTSARADNPVPARDHASAPAAADTSMDLSAQRRGGGARGGHPGAGRQVGGRQVGGRQVGGRQVGRQVGRQIGYEGRFGRYGRYGRFGRYGRVGYVGRVGFVPVPVGPGIAPGPGVMQPGPTCPTCPAQACLVAVYSEQGLQGQSFETRDNQPRLDLNQWQNQTASIIVKGGTWDFFPDLEFRGGQPLRLVPGSYAVLEPQWTKRIGSFMCVR